jgi:uncharacterized protein YciI
MNFVVVHHFLKSDITEAMMKPHVQYLESLFTRGKLVITGPFTDEKRGGMFILDVESETELHDIVNDDPAIRSGIARSEVRPYRIVFQQGR